MKIIGPVSQEEMQATHPDLMGALAADPADVSYCLWCDGLRTHDSEHCPGVRDCPLCGAHAFHNLGVVNRRLFVCLGCKLHAEGLW